MRSRIKKETTNKTNASLRLQMEQNISPKAFKLYEDIEIPRLDYHRMSNRQIRRFIYASDLAEFVFFKSGKQVRYSSRTELADLLRKLSA